MKRSEDIKELAKAMCKMQSEMESAFKGVQAHQYKYADMASVWSVLKIPLTSNGLTVSQETFNLPEGPSVSTLLMHTSGQWMETSPLTIPTGKKDAHASGSALTYAKRYQLCALLGIITDDDDGKAAQMDAPSQRNSPVDTVIDEATWEKLDEYLNGHEDIRQKIKELCKVNDLRNIKNSQISGVRAYVAKKLRMEKDSEITSEQQD